MLCIQSWLIWKRSILISQWMSYIGTQYQMRSMLACHRYIYTYKYNAFFVFLFVKIFFFTFCIRLFHAWIITKSRAFAFDSSYSVWVYDCMMHVWSIYTITISVYRTYWSRFFFFHIFFLSRSLLFVVVSSQFGLMVWLFVVSFFLPIFIIAVTSSMRMRIRLMIWIYWYVTAWTIIHHKLNRFLILSTIDCTNSSAGIQY